ncbi:MAG: hypothetical protein ABI781_11540 [Burkholderiales bacterium]
MELEPLMGRYFRLRQELSIAYRARPWLGTRIDRLADDLAATEREIGALQAASRDASGASAGGAQHG